MEIVRHLNTLLPPGYRSGPQVHLESMFEIDIGTFDAGVQDLEPNGSSDSNGGIATQTVTSATLTVDAEALDQDEYEVRIYDTERGRHLVAAIEIVSPTSKDPPENRVVFAGKVAALLQHGVCVTMIDLVSVRQANLYAEFLNLIGRTDPRLATPPPGMYAVTLRTRKPPKGRMRLDGWFTPLVVGQPLPTLPIWLSDGLHLMFPFETSYQSACDVLAIR